MSRINIEDSLFSDPRYTRLVLAMGDQYAALGALVYAFTLAQRFWIASKGKGIPEPVWKKYQLPQALIDTGFVDIRGDFYYVSGSKKQFSWLTQRSNAGRQKSHSVAPRSRNHYEIETTESNETQRNGTSFSSSFSSSNTKNIYTQNSLPDFITQEWKETCKHYGVTVKNTDEVDLYRAFQLVKDWGRVKNAIIGFRYDHAGRGYDPKAHFKIQRLTEREKFTRLENLGEIKPGKPGKTKINWEGVNLE